ncbi:MAG: VOC family protein [Thermomicrobiales bacterium]|nr:VOC family protein [Thermomicrobiales bacterium]
MHPKLDLIGIVVSDMARSLAFYRALGLEIPPNADAEGHVEVALPGGVRLAWDTEAVIRSFDETFAPVAGAGRVGLAFLCDSPAAVDATYAALTSQGYHGHKAPWDAFWGQRYAIVQDPDGTEVSLFAPLGEA